MLCFASFPSFFPSFSLSFPPSPPPPSPPPPPPPRACFLLAGRAMLSLLPSFLPSSGGGGQTNHKREASRQAGRQAGNEGIERPTHSLTHSLTPHGSAAPPPPILQHLLRCTFIGGMPGNIAISLAHSPKPPDLHFFFIIRTLK